MIRIYNTQNAPNRPRGATGSGASAGSNKKNELRGKSKGKGARFSDRPIVSL
jgi:hypothetical protein